MNDNIQKTKKDTNEVLQRSRCVVIKPQSRKAPRRTDNSTLEEEL